jgi:hypothetical protein
MMPDRSPALLSSALCGLALLAAQGASAQVAPPRTGDLARRTVSSERLAGRESVVPLAEAEPLLAPEARDGWTAFTLGAPGEWRAYADRRTGRIEYAEGAGLPWIPGRGNQLTPADVVSGGGPVDLAALEKIARGFLGRTGKLLGVDPATLVLDRGRSGPAADYLWFVDFDLVRDGRTVEGARVTLTVNNGNLIQFGTVQLPPPDAAVPAIEIERAAALAVLSGHVGGFTPADHFVDPGSLHLLPADVADTRSALGFEPGRGRGLVAVWEFRFRRDRVMGTWRGRVDATTGELLDFTDVNDYAQVTGGVYPRSFATDAEVDRPLPFAGLSSGVFTDSAGFYDYLGGTVSSQLTGPYVGIYDYCGTIGQSGSGSGFIHFGLSAGTDCATPGSGGLGNTHSARMQFYQVNRIKELGRGWLPNNSWLSAPLGVNVNLPQVCNAYWDGLTLNFFHSGSGCGNTGEIAGVSLHEYGHGLDQNDGGGESPDGGTRESYADVTAALVTHDSCGGTGFFSGNCGGYGDACTACSGVRDIDWARHTSGAPHTVANFTQTLCPVGGGPCGREAHCESYLPSEAMWDFAARDLPAAGAGGIGGNAAWAVVERLWYRSRATAGSAFTCNTAPATWTSDGCAAGTLWRVLRAADDDDGNLANGTPHSCALYAALARHGIACPGDPAATTCFAACTPPAVPTLTLTPGPRQMRLDWTDVSGSGTGVVYDVYRNEASCNSGFTRIATVPLGTAYLDSAVTDGLSYNYQVIARPSGNEACSAAPSICRSAAPVAPACGLAAPAALTATAVSTHQVTLTWSAVPGATDYNVYRAPASGGPYSLVRSLAAPATTWTDTALASGTAVFYVVRAAADCSSPSSPEATATPFVCSGTPIYSNDFESGSGLGDWTTGPVASQPSEWRGIQACDAHSGQKVFHFGGPGCTDNYDTSQNSYAQVGGLTGIAVPAGVSDSRLSFWHRFDFEHGFDSGSLTLSLDGRQFVTIPATAYLANPPTGFNSGFTGTQSTFVHSIVDLDAACDLANTGNTGGLGCAGRTIYLRFVAQSDPIINAQGWFLDDVAVSACTPHGCTGAPSAGAATTPANGQIRVNWTNGVPPSATFDVYRALGTCASPGPFTRIASQTAGSTFLDTTAPGTVTFAYRITGLEPTGQCESDPSACLQATATGPCTGPPLFAGLASAGNGAIDLCSANLAWAPATAYCGGPLTYNVYRGTTAGFTPAPGNRIATGVLQTNFADLGPLTDSTTYYYVVRAVDGANGVEDGNLVRKSATPTGPITINTFLDTFEGSAAGGGFDHPGWSHAALSGSADWSWSNFVAQSPTHSWYSYSLSTVAADRVLVSPSFGVIQGTTLSFWHTFSFFDCFDGGTLEISTDAGATWSLLPYPAYTAGNPQYYIYPSPNPLSNQLGWCYGNVGTPTQVIVDLSSYAGSQARLRWHAGDSGYSSTTSSWYVDSVSILHTQTTATCSSTPPAPLRFYTLPPCRLIDTRNPNGPLGGPALPASAQRTFTLPGVCGLPPTARAVAVNLTVVSPPAAGDLRLFAADRAAPFASAINFAAGQTRTNNALVGLSPAGALTLQNDAGSGVTLVVDLVGYFQ